MNPWRYSPQWNIDVTIPNEPLTSQSPMIPWRYSPQWNLDVTIPNGPLTSQSPMNPCIFLIGIFVVWYMYRILNTGLISNESLTDILALYVGLMYNHVFSDKSFTYTGYRVIQVDRTAAVPTGCATIELHVYNTYTLFSFFFCISGETHESPESYSLSFNGCITHVAVNNWTRWLEHICMCEYRSGET